MNWTTIPDGGSTQGRLNTWDAWYNGTTLFKARYTWSSPSTGKQATSTDSKSVISFASYSPATGEITDSVTGTVHCAFYKAYDYAETALKNSGELYAFRQNDDTTKWLANVYYQTDAETAIYIHSGKDISGNALCKATTSKNTAMLDLLSFTTAQNTFNNSYGSDYIVQPLCIYDEKTPFYLISGNANLAEFTTVAICDRVFMSIGNGICVEMNV